MRNLFIPHTLVVFSSVVLLGGGSCKDKADAVDEEAKPTVKVEKTEKKSVPSKPVSAGRYTKEEIRRVLVTLKACVDESTEVGHVAACGCRSDLLLSKEAQPADPDAYCAGFASKMADLSELSEEQQLEKEVLLTATDVPMPGSAGLFSFAVPCLIEAGKAKSEQQYERCVCVTHEIANRLAIEKIKTNADMAEAFGRVVPDLQANSQCK